MDRPFFIYPRFQARHIKQEDIIKGELIGVSLAVTLYFNILFKKSQRKLIDLIKIFL